LTSPVEKRKIKQMAILHNPSLAEHNVWEIQWHPCRNLPRYLPFGLYFLCLSTPVYDRDIAGWRGDRSRSYPCCQNFGLCLLGIHCWLDIDLYKRSRWAENLFFSLVGRTNCHLT